MINIVNKNFPDDEYVSSPTSKSQQSSETKQKSQTKKNLSSKHHQKILPEKQSKRMKLAVTAIDLETSDEDGNIYVNMNIMTILRKIFFK